VRTAVLIASIMLFVSCQSASPSMDKAEQASGNRVAVPIMILPFSSENEPKGIIPIGETTRHPNDMYGHVGLDFQFDYQPPLIAVADGIVVDIISYDESPSGTGDVFDVAIGFEGFMAIYSGLAAVSNEISIDGKVIKGQIIGYPYPVGPPENGWHMTHWEFGQYQGGRTFTRLCPVPYFTVQEQDRLKSIWQIAYYDEKDKFPDLCNGIWRNY